MVGFYWDWRVRGNEGKAKALGNFVTSNLYGESGFASSPISVVEGGGNHYSLRINADAFSDSRNLCVSLPRSTEELGTGEVTFIDLGTLNGYSLKDPSAKAEMIVDRLRREIDNRGLVFSNFGNLMDRSVQHMNEIDEKFSGQTDKLSRIIIEEKVKSERLGDLGPASTYNGVVDIGRDFEYETRDKITHAGEFHKSTTGNHLYLNETSIKNCFFSRETNFEELFPEHRVVEMQTPLSDKLEVGIDKLKLYHITTCNTFEVARNADRNRLFLSHNGSKVYTPGDAHLLTILEGVAETLQKNVVRIGTP